MKTVSLVLGSGGARGLAHIGVIQWLEENGYQIQSISGCSSGAMVGGVYAAGKLDEFEHWSRAITKVDMISLLDISWNGSGLVKGDKLINTLVELVGDILIEDLPMPYTAVAVDIRDEKQVWINDGNLFDAIRASISLPLFFTPVPRNGATLIDGGILNPIPIAPTFGDDTDLTIAVNLGGRPRQQSPNRETSGPEEKSEQDGFRETIRRYINKLPKIQTKHSEEDWGLYDIAMQAIESMQGTIASHNLAAYPPDHIIEIPRNAATMLEVHRAEELISLGYKKAAESLPAADS